MKKYKNDELKNLLIPLCSIRERLFRKGYIKSNKIVGELVEYFASKILDLKLNEKSNKINYDAIDRNRKRVQIKTRQQHKRNPKPYVYRGFEGKLNFDYSILVMLDENYWVKEIWKISRQNIKNYRTKKGVINFLDGRKNKIALKVYP